MLSNFRISLRTIFTLNEVNNLRTSLACIQQNRPFQTCTVSAKKKAPRPPPVLRIGPMKWIPPPNSDPILVREDSIIKSIIQLDKSYPIKCSRLDEIGRSPTGWIERMVPPPKLPFQIKRNKHNRFDVNVERKKKHKPYTVVSNIQGDIDELHRCLRWRLGKQQDFHLNKNTKVLVVLGFHKRTINTLFQALGF